MGRFRSEPFVFNDTTMISFHDVDGYRTLIDVFEFTTDGAVLIVSREILR